VCSNHTGVDQLYLLSFLLPFWRLHFFSAAATPVFCDRSGIPILGRSIETSSIGCVPRTRRAEVYRRPYGGVSDFRVLKSLFCQQNT
jgi:hypothetical protein